MIGPTPPEKRYELVERIAVGGMAEVFRAKSYGPHGFEKVLAIKRILPGLAADPKFERRFITEAKLAVSLTHANIVQVLDFSRFGQSLYIVMEYVDGGDLAHVLDALRERGGHLPLAAAIHVSSELLKGLDFAHRRGVVHRDVSPSNILLSRAGEVKIADFGIAQGLGFEMSRSMRIMGKWRYMSPEQAAGQEMDARSDVFSAGVVVYETLTGLRLFPGETAEEIVRNLRTMPIPRPSQVRADLPPELDAPLAAALERDRDRRTTSAAQLLAPLVEVSYARSLPALPTALARFLDQIAPEGPPAGRARTEPEPEPESAPDSRPGTGAALLDEIIVSELSAAGPIRTTGGKRGARSGRHTAMALGPPAVAPEDLPSDPPEALLPTQALPAPPPVPAGPPAAILRGELADDEPEETAASGTFIRSIEDSSGARRWELGDDDGDDDRDDDEEGDVTRAIEAQAPDTPVPRLLPLRADMHAALADTIVRQASPLLAPSHRAPEPLSRTATIVSASPPMARPSPPSPQAQAVADATGQRAASRGRADSLLPLVTSRRLVGLAAAVVAAGALIGVVIAHSPGRDSSGAGARLPALASQIGAAAPSTPPAPTASPATAPSTAAATAPSTAAATAPSTAAATAPSTSAAATAPSTAAAATAPSTAAATAPSTAAATAPSTAAATAPSTSATAAAPPPEAASAAKPVPRVARARAPEPPDEPARPASGERRERTGSVDIYADPWANIYLGKRKVGVAPQRGVRLPIGRHRLHLVNPVLRRSAWVTVTVPASGPVRVSLPDHR
jgi:eukaryotic-like serine/threonine-protein kinase